MEIRLSKQSIKFLQKQNEPHKSRIKDGIANLPNGDIKKLQGSTEFYRLRIGNYRIVYRFLTQEIIYIDRIGLRGQIYKIL